MDLDNPTPKRPSRTQTFQSFDIQTHWQGPCRGCHHHHHARLFNIHISRERNIQKQDFYCERCQKFLFCLGQSQRRWSLLSQITNPGEGGDPSQAPSGRRACFYRPPDGHNNLGQRSRSIDRSSSQSARGLHSDPTSFPDEHTENSEETTYSTAAKVAGQETEMSTHNHSGLRELARRLVTRVRRPWRKLFNRSKPCQPSPYQNAQLHSSPNSDDSPSQPADSTSAQNNDTRQGFPEAPVLGSDGQNNDKAPVQDGGHTDDAELEKISKIRQEKTAIAKAQELVCRCESDCDCREHDHGHSDHSYQSTDVHPRSSIPSFTDSNPRSRSRDSREFNFMGQWMKDQPTERRFESQSTHRQSMATFSSTSTAAMSHDDLGLTEPPPRAPSPPMNPSSRLLNTPSQSRSQLRLSTNLGPGLLEPVGEASSTSETSLTQRNAFNDHAVNQPQTKANEGSAEHEFHQRESTDHTF